VSTPFALLEKRAYWGDPVQPQYSPQAGYQYQQGASGLNNPYAQAKPLVAQPGLGKQIGMLGAEVGADMALGSNPLTGIPWFLGKTIYNAAKGNWGDAAMNFGMGALSILPGAATAAAGAKGAITAGRVGSLALKSQKVLQGAGRIGQATARAGGRYATAVSKMQQGAQSGINAVKAMPAYGQAARHASKVTQPLNKGISTAKNFVTQPGKAQGLRTTAWNAAALPGRMVTGTNAKFLLPQAAGMALPNNPLQNPDPSNAPAPMRNNGGLLDAMSEAIASGAPPQ
jgi:hypothetical protein